MNSDLLFYHTSVRNYKRDNNGNSIQNDSVPTNNGNNINNNAEKNKTNHNNNDNINNKNSTALSSLQHRTAMPSNQ